MSKPEKETQNQSLENKVKDEGTNRTIELFADQSDIEVWTSIINQSYFILFETKKRA